MSRPLAHLLTLALVLVAHLARGAEPVAPPLAKASADDERIRVSVVRELARDPHLVATGISCAVDSGIVELSGAVPVPRWRERAERVARVVLGVRAVANRLRVVSVLRPDRELEKAVRSAVRATAALRQLPIQATVSDGIVELRGWITSWEEQQLAEKVVSGVPGVRYCQNQLAASGRIARSEAVLAADIRSRFDWDPLLLHDPIRVDVRGTRVSLSGGVGSAAEARRASSLAWVKGVTAVDASKLQLVSPRPDDNLRAQWPSDAEMTATATELARFWPNVVMSNVSVTVLDATATLRGTVQTQRESLAVAEMARAVVGVVRVDNQLRGPWWREPTPPAPAPRRRPGVRR